VDDDRELDATVAGLNDLELAGEDDEEVGVAVALLEQDLADGGGRARPQPRRRSICYGLRSWALRNIYARVAVVVVGVGFRARAAGR
jgi:hypothetical protein